MPWLFLFLIASGCSTQPIQPVAAPNRFVNIFTRSDGRYLHFYAQNLQLTAITTTFEMNFTNMSSRAHFPLTSTLAAGETVEVFTLEPIDDQQPQHYSCINSAIIGSVDAVHDDTCIYSLPYAPGNSFRVSQGYHGRFSHRGPDEFAIDWKMPEGTEVYAAREGLVVKSKDDSNRGGPRPEFESSANCILIRPILPLLCGPL